MPPDHLFGFSGSDWVELILIVSVIALTWKPWIENAARRLAARPVLSMVVLAILPVALRLILLRNHPAPIPDLYDEFGHLLVADTLRHFRLANPPHPFPQFFETFFVLQQPTYSSIYPIGQGLILALGWNLFGHPWAGVILATAAMCALTYWMLLGWTTSAWAFVGGVLAVFEFGPLCPWMNNYWGGSFAAAAGCLVFGALPRLRERARTRDAALLGTGLAIHALIRPYESIFLAIGVVSYLWLWPPKKNRLKIYGVSLSLLAAAIAISFVQNKQVTGRWSEFPYSLSQYQYGVPASLTLQNDPVPHRALTREQELEYKSQLAFRGEARETLRTFLLRLEYRVRFYRFYFLAPLYLALPFFFSAFGERKWIWVAATVLILSLGTNFFPAFQFHYLAGVACLFVLISVIGLRQLGRLAPDAPRLLLALCVAQFAFWYAAHLLENDSIPRQALDYETWDGINHENAPRRRMVQAELDHIPGKLLVFVSYWPNHIFQDEWVYNSADLDQSRIVWARDLGKAENQKLLEYYAGRSVYLLEPDASPPRLSRY